MNRDNLLQIYVLKHTQMIDNCSWISYYIYLTYFLNYTLGDLNQIFRLIVIKHKDEILLFQMKLMNKTKNIDIFTETKNG